MDDFFLSDSEIKELLREQKHLGIPVERLIQAMVPKKHVGTSMKQHTHTFDRANGNEKWRIYLRQSLANPFDFSCGFELIPEGRQKAFRLIRCNGKSHWHTNRLEGEERFLDFHIHRATERYQLSSYSPDHYANVTDRYTSLREALSYLLDECRIAYPASAQRELLS